METATLSPPHVCQHFSVDCPSRALLDQIADKWSMMVLTVLDAGPMRFNAIRRHLEGVTQKALTQCLRRIALKRSGPSSSTVSTIIVHLSAIWSNRSRLGQSLEKRRRHSALSAGRCMQVS